MFHSSDDLRSNKISDYVKYLKLDTQIVLESGFKFDDCVIAYETYGQLNAEKNNAILICHAISGDSHVSKHDDTDADGWWDIMVGSGLYIDTNKYFIICANVLGGCMGSFGPKEINPETNKLFETTFPVITIKDMVKVQKYLLDYLGIKKLLAVAGGSMGGMQVLQFVSLYQDMAHSAIPIACSASHSAQNIAFNELGRQAIMADPNWKKENATPDKGLAVARMAAHITYLSKQGLQEKFGRKLQDKGSLKFSFDADFQIESYLRYQSSSFVERFDANTYLLMTKALDYFDPAKEFDDDLTQAVKAIQAKSLIISFTSDWRFSPLRSLEIVDALLSAGKSVSYAEIEATQGHDAFLMPIPRYMEIFASYMQQVAKEVNS